MVVRTRLFRVQHKLIQLEAIDQAGWSIYVVGNIVAELS
jgi:hypothetical protein